MREHTLIGFAIPQAHVRFNFMLTDSEGRRKPAFCVGTDRKDALARLGNILDSCERLGASIEITGSSATTEAPTSFGKADPEVQRFFWETSLHDFGPRGTQVTPPAFIGGEDF